MAIVWKSKNPGATKEMIRQFEDTEQIVLPKGYKAFLQDMNGGQVESGYIPYTEHFGKTVFTIMSFCDLNELSRRRFNIMKAFADEDENEFPFPNKLLFIADSLGGHEGLVLHLETENVYLWFDYRPQILVASTFDDFLRVVRSGEWNEEDVI